MDWMKKLRYMAEHYSAGAVSRGGERRHYLQDAVDEIDRLRAELRNIAEAKRFDRSVFEDDTAFADWVQSRCRWHIRGDAEADAAVKRGAGIGAA